MKSKWKLALIATMIVAFGSTACVDQQASVLMMGSIVGEYDSEAGSCEYTLDLEDTQRINTVGFVNLAHLDAVGQPVIANGPPAAGTNVYFFTALYQNQLVDSRTVGAEGGGGGGGGYTNLTLNQNDILITSATVHFPADSNTFNINNQPISFPDTEHERLFSMLVTSGEGVALSHIPLINGHREAAAFDEFLAGTGLPANEIITFMVEIQLHGETMAGNRIESNRFVYPIQMCRDCGPDTTSMCVTGS